jgi:hypothetical protein
MSYVARYKVARSYVFLYMSVSHAGVSVIAGKPVDI